MICRQSAVNFPAGTDFAYSNSGYLLLAEVVRGAGGEPRGIRVSTKRARGVFFAR